MPFANPLIQVDDVIGAYEVDVRVHSYHNPTGRCNECRVDRNSDRPGCCDEERDLDVCSARETCDTFANLCIRPLESTVTSCAVTISGRTLMFNTNYIDFESLSDFFGLPNPLLFLNNDGVMVRKQCMGLIIYNV